MIDLNVAVEKTSLGWIRGLTGQARFAAARALTLTAQDAQMKVVDELPRRFTIRNRWVPGGIRYRPATKSDLVAQVGSATDFMGLQETGGSKPHKSQSVALPTANIRRNKRGIITKGKRPRRLLDKPKYFIREEGDRRAIFERIGGKKRRGLRLLYTLEKRAQVRPRFGLFDTVEAVVDDRFEDNFSLAFRRALETAR